MIGRSSVAETTGGTVNLGYSSEGPAGESDIQFSVTIVFFNDNCIITITQRTLESLVHVKYSV